VLHDLGLVERLVVGPHQPAADDLDVALAVDAAVGVHVAIAVLTAADLLDADLLHRVLGKRLPVSDEIPGGFVHGRGTWRVGLKSVPPQPGGHTAKARIMAQNGLLPRAGHAAGTLHGAPAPSEPADAAGPAG
jgi:hypothetical protein